MGSFRDTARLPFLNLRTGWIMAKILSQVDTVRRGSVGGVTYTANSYSAIIARARVVPVNPQTKWQNGLRGAFKASSDRYRDLLTAQEREDWKFAATNFPYSGPLGTYYIPGRNLFIAAKTYRAFVVSQALFPTLLDLDTILLAGGWFFSGTVNVVPPSDAGTGFDIQFVRLQPGVNAVSTAQISPAQLPTVNYFTGPFMPEPNNATLTPGGTSTLLKIRGKAEGMRYFIKTRSIYLLDGSSISQPFYHNIIASTFV